jgi:hypothetical protein
MLSQQHALIAEDEAKEDRTHPHSQDISVVQTIIH